MAQASKSVAVGDAAPDFSLPDAEGKQVSLKDFKGKKHIVLYFYPKDDTPGCTKESCSFRDHYDVFKQAGAEVIGVSSDSVASHRQFKSSHRLPFILLSDEGGKTRKLYGVPSTFGVLPGRVTYVIDREGVVRHVFSSQIRISRHIEDALKTIQSMNQ